MSNHIPARSEEVREFIFEDIELDISLGSMARLREHLEEATRQAKVVPESLATHLESAPAWLQHIDERLPYFRREGDLVVVSDIFATAAPAKITFLGGQENNPDLELVAYDSETEEAAFIFPANLQTGEDTLTQTRGVICDPMIRCQTLTSCTMPETDENRTENRYTMARFLIELLQSKR